MQNPLAAALSMRVLLFLSAVFFSAGVLASPAPEKPGSIKIVSRQAAGTVLNQALACAQYSRIANMSVVSANSTMRTTFLMLSPDGTLANSAMLNQAQLALPALTADAQLNQECGNLTTLATTEAANNLTKGIVLQFTFDPTKPLAVDGGPAVIFSTVAALFIICLPLTMI